MKSTNLEAFGAALLWLVPFLAGARLRWGSSAHRRRWLSVAAGIGIAYVFVDLLPQMNRMQRTFTAATEGKVLPIPELRVYLSALVGFVAFYSLQSLVGDSRSQPEGVSPLVRRMDFCGFASYCGLMSYLLVADAEASLISLVLYCVAMFFHFWLIDHSLRREYGGLYDRGGRWLIVACILAGWLIGATGFSSNILVPTLLGFIGGGVVINSVRAELPERGEGRALPLMMGALAYAILLVTVQLAEKESNVSAISH